MKRFRLFLVLAIALISIGVAGVRLSQPEPEMAAAAPVNPAPVKTESIAVQRFSVDLPPAAVRPTTLFTAVQGNYHLSYPNGWKYTILSGAAVQFYSPTEATTVTVELAGPVPIDGLAAYVTRSLGPDTVYSRQLLTVHGLPAERVITVAAESKTTVTTFYIAHTDVVVKITGFGQQHAIEMMARSFNAPLLLAQK
jgi:hypothetical protein